MATVTLKGTPCHTIGDLPKVGEKAPDFKLTDKDLNDVSLSTFQGKKKLLYVVPSLDTPVCAASTKKLDAAAADHPDTVILIVSADLPFAMGRFCSAENTANVVVLSMMRTKQFGKDYGVLLTDGPLAGVTARAVIVIDAQDKVVHTELVPEIAQEPDYDKALSALA